MYQLRRKEAASSADAGAADSIANSSKIVLTIMFPPSLRSAHRQFTLSVRLRRMPGNDKTLQQLDREVDQQSDCPQHHHGGENHLRVQVAVILQQQIAEPSIRGDE